MNRSICLFLILLLSFTAAAQKSNPTKSNNNFTLDDFYGNNSLLDKKVQSVMDTMSIDGKLSQMIMSTLGHTPKSYTRIENVLKNRSAGSIFINRGTAEQMATWIYEMRKISAEAGSVPIMFACDAEPALINRKIKGLQPFTRTEDIKTSDENIKTADEIASIIKQMGFNINFAPVCDVNINRSAIKYRSYGKDEKEIGNRPSEFITTTQNARIAAAAKHFPGHGTVKGDTHKQMVFIDKNLVEIPIFKKAIQSNVIFVMVGHIGIKNHPRFSTDNLPATLSEKVIRKLLRDSLGFKGLVVTDAMNMKGVSRIKKAPLKAVEAGCDIILNPGNERIFISDLKEKIKTSPSLKLQTENSVRKIVRLKVCLGVIK